MLILSRKCSESVVIGGADGEKRAEIQKAEGIKQAKLLAAEGEAEAIRLVNEAAGT